MIIDIVILLYVISTGLTFYILYRNVKDINYLVEHISLFDVLRDLDDRKIDKLEERLEILEKQQKYVNKDKHNE